MSPQVMVMVVPRGILVEVVQTVPLPLNLEDDVDMNNICSNMRNLKKSIISMNNSLIDLLECQQRMENDTTHALQVIHQSQ